ncbi:uncharacterized protein LY89DRAFT_692549 [Mollisia scopiformis]|uniref:DUF6594 domain-containing protein n=1 Tax=Mollisia scopiformis TaxID=149040 RepID=A0A132B1P3_MOLSC|nr:uncharacterized protein LY89DRAFT_692549 [Mollisia scopiformis]KUJ06296.1 hypothetical protein LY89DRAFT_692549 [Mollisia scopiformis]
MESGDTSQLHGREKVDVELFRYVAASLDKEEIFHVLGFEFLQRYNLVRLQNKLAKIRESIHADLGQKCDERSLNDTLNEYSQSIKNYNMFRGLKPLSEERTEERKALLKTSFPSLMSQCRWTKPFESHYYALNDNKAKVDNLRKVLRHLLPRHLAYSNAERVRRQREFEEGKPPHEISAVVDRLSRLIVALAGGAFLIVPMLIMAINPTQTKSLVTASVGTLLFSCAISLGLSSSNNETMVSTATYAAVLVVFVGITTTNNSIPTT